MDGSLSLSVLRLLIACTENNKSKSVLSCCYESLHCSKILQLLPYLALCTAGGFIFNKNLQHYLARRSTMKSTTVKEQFFYVGDKKHYDGDKLVTVRDTVSPLSLSRDMKKILNKPSATEYKTKPIQYPTLMVCNFQSHSRRKIKKKYPFINSTIIRDLYRTDRPSRFDCKQ